jgi:hypothetical protein
VIDPATRSHPSTCRETDAIAAAHTGTGDLAHVHRRVTDATAGDALGDAPA